MDVVQVAAGLLCGLAIVPSGNFSPHPLGVAWEARSPFAASSPLPSSQLLSSCSMDAAKVLP